MARRARKPLTRAFQALKREAKQKEKVLDESFFVELDNYSRHLKVSRLPDDKLTIVIRSIGRKALSARRVRIGGGHVRGRVMQLCPDPFSDCFDAAVKVLRSAGVDPKGIPGVEL